MAWPTKHGVRRLEDQHRLGALDDAAEARVAELVAHYAEDAGGLAALSNRELSVLRDVAVCDLIIAEAFKWAHGRGEIIDAAGQLLPVLGKNLLAYLNTKRRGLEALGLRPETAEKVPPLSEYLKAKASPPAPAPNAPAPATVRDAVTAEESDT